MVGVKITKPTRALLSGYRMNRYLTGREGKGICMRLPHVYPGRLRWIAHLYCDTCNHRSSKGAVVLVSIVRSLVRVKCSAEWRGPHISDYIRKMVFHYCVFVFTEIPHDCYIRSECTTAFFCSLRVFWRRIPDVKPLQRICNGYLLEDLSIYAFAFFSFSNQSNFSRVFPPVLLLWCFCKPSVKSDGCPSHMAGDSFPGSASCKRICR